MWSRSSCCKRQQLGLGVQFEAKLIEGVAFVTAAVPVLPPQIFVGEEIGGYDHQKSAGGEPITALRPAEGRAAIHKPLRTART